LAWRKAYDPPQSIDTTKQRAYDYKK
jgi:hypothetical protein